MEEPNLLTTGVIAILYCDEDHVVNVFLKTSSINSGDVRTVEMTMNQHVKTSQVKSPYLLEHCQMNEQEGVIVFPRCVHGDVVSYLETYKPDYKLRYKWMLQMVKAVYHMHEVLHLAHMDLSPENFMVTKELDIKLGDFAQACSTDHPLLIRNTVGKKVYRAYEITTCTEIENPKACDMWSLGIVIFTLFFNYFLWESPGCINFRTFMSQSTLFWKTVATWIPSTSEHVLILNIVKLLVCLDPKKRISITHLQKFLNIS